ncbi:MAG: SIS domain-containing protein [Coxiellaceae bacterium]|nr:SIS domain-containing protein [Coxiellaceae bacterium]
MLPVVILAGGLATRMRPMTETIPKALIDVAGEPFIFHQLRYLKQQGVERVVLCVGYLGDMVREVVGDGAQFGLDVTYSFDGECLLGTGGAIKKALPLLADAFFVLYGDSFLPINYQDVFRAFERQSKPALMTVLANQNRWDKSNVLFQDGQLLSYDKISPTTQMDHIDYGLGIISSSTIVSYPDDVVIDLADVYHQLSEQHQLAGFEVFERFYEIGSPTGLEQTTNYFKVGEDMLYTQQHLNEAVEIINQLDVDAIERMADLLAEIKRKEGRIFFLGVGGSAANCSHAVNDFRKIVGIESYAPTDNASELTARTNDEGWATIFATWLKTSKLSEKDALFILSVGGGNLEKNISPNLVEALKFASSVNAKVTGIVGRDGGYTAKVADACVIVPTVNADTITPHAEAFQAVIWHLLVSHPKLKSNQTMWESTVEAPAKAQVC